MRGTARIPAPEIGTLWSLLTLSKSVHSDVSRYGQKTLQSSNGQSSSQDAKISKITSAFSRPGLNFDRSTYAVG